MSVSSYQLIIIGGGPAGLMAATYAGRSQLRTALISAQPGGMISWAHRVNNFPAQPEITGLELSQKMIAQAEQWKVKLITAEATNLKKENGQFIVQTDDNQIFRAETLLLALGTQKRKLNLPEEEKFIGRGLSYCSLCDGQFFQGKTVAVCGSGDAAATTAIYLSDIADRVYLIARRADLKCCPSWRKAVDQRQNIEMVCPNQITALIGSGSLSKLELKEPYRNSRELAVDGLFVEIGLIPSSLIARQLDLKIDPDGFIEIQPNGQTSQEGVWAAGDITTGSNKLWQAVTAAAEGAIAANDIYKYINRRTNPEEA